jgi:FKBP-type peptidyl-prolyl cis-trans isomerase SlyD
VVLDGNHPLAGMSLRMHIQVRDVREATPEETEARTVGGEPVMVLGPGASRPEGPLH